MIEVRRATNEEAKELHSFDEFIGDRRINNSRGELHIATIDEEIVGFIVITANWFFDHPFVNTVCVKKEHRKKGVGLALFSEVLKQYSEIDVWTSTEEWNTSAIRLFDKLNFECRGKLSEFNGDKSAELFFLKKGTLS